MSFSEIVGHEKVVAALRRALRSGRLAHAYLFVGPVGVGKSTTAWEFAKALQCPVSVDDACEQCRDCGKVRERTHPDVVWVEPQGKQILVEQIRELQRRLAYKPLEGLRRVAIVQAAQEMNVQAANALLKLLEEPPEDTVMLLLAGSESSLLPTVVSRCQKMRFAPLPTGLVAEYLEQRAGWDPETAGRIAPAAQGSIGRALLLKEEPVALWGQEAREVLSSILGSSALELLEKARKWASSRQEALARLEVMRCVVRDLLLDGVKGGPLKTGPAASSRAVQIKWLLDVWEMTGKAVEALDRNINQQLLLENLLVSIRQRAAALGEAASQSC